MSNKYNEKYFVEFYSIVKSAGWKIQNRTITDVDKLMIDTYKHSFNYDFNKYPFIKRWIVSYDKLQFSVYFDSADLLGMVGNEYFEFYCTENPFGELMNSPEIEDTSRFDYTPGNKKLHYLKKFLNNLKYQYDELKKTNPEHLV